jgi:hypothetical protein
MKKLQLLFLPTILALAFSLMLSCAPTDHTHDDQGSSSDSSSGDTSSSDNSTPTTDSTSSAITLSGKIQKGPYVQGTEITVRELDSSMIPTGNTFTSTIDDHTGSFSIKGTLTNKIVELSGDGYYFNEVSGSLSTAKLTLSALSDITDNSSVNVNLMTHLEKKRVEYLMDNSKMTFVAAKTQAQMEIMKIFNIDNVTLGNSETLDISKSGDGNAVLLAISTILQSDKTEAELTELLSTINTDIRTDGTLDSTNTKATLVTAIEYLKSRRSTIRTNIETRYSNLGISATIPAFESYAFKLDTTAPTVSSTSHGDYPRPLAKDNTTISVTFSEMMDNTSITTNTSDTSCSGTVQVSADSFSTCVQMSSSPTESNDNKTFTVTPSSSLSFSTTYKIRVTTGVKDLAPNTLSSQYETGTGFTSEAIPSYVSVGNQGTILTSGDGTTWSSRTSSALNLLNEVTYGNSTFVSVGTDGTIITSSDGISWTSRTSGTSNSLQGSTYVNSTFVTVGGDGTILTSSDGISWTSRTSGTSNSLEGSTYGNSTFVLVGTTGTIITSSDGISWTSRTSGTSKELRGIIYANSTFVTVGDNGTILTSGDGTSWTARTSGIASNDPDESNELYGVTYGNNTFVTVGDSGYILTSSNGNSWTSRTSGTSIELKGIIYANSTFVTVGDNGTILTSSDGISWTSRTSGTSNRLKAVTFKE